MTILKQKQEGYKIAHQQGRFVCRDQKNFFWDPGVQLV